MDHHKSSEPIRVVIHGATGRMGQSVIRAAARSDGFQIVAGIAPSATAARDALAMDWPDAQSTTEISAVEAEFDAVIDFSAPDGAVAAARSCREASRPLVCGTTGLDEKQMDALKDAAAAIAVLHASNMGIGINLLRELIYRAALVLGEDTDVEILDSHHRHKKDAPSGTALTLGRAVADAWGVDFEQRAVFDRSAAKESRVPGSIGFQSVRAGDIVGEHQVIFALDGERLELGHRATDRNVFAQGALTAARWLVQQPPGFYSMRDVLELKY